MKERQNYIDIAKGIGILVVIFSHSGGQHGLMTIIGGFFIPLFFVVSGYTLSMRDGQGYGAFMVKKAKRLLVPYVFFSIGLLLLYRCFLSTDIIGAVYSRYCLYPFHEDNNVFFLRAGNAPLWFLTSMFVTYGAVWGLMKSGKYLPYVVIIYLLLTYVLDFLPILLPWSLDTAFLMALFIYIGTWIKKMRIDNKIKSNVFIWVSLPIVYVLFCYLNGEPNLSVREYAHSFLLILVTGTIGSLIVIRLSQHLEHTCLCRVLSAFGRHSLVIFCIQMFLLHKQNQLFFDILHMPLNTWTLYASSILKTFLVAVIGVYASKGLKRILPNWF